MESRKQLRRPRTGRILAGVCAGIAEFFDLDPTVVRVAYIFLSIFTVFAGALAYIVLWIVIPERRLG